MSRPDPSITNLLLERIIGAQGGLILLRCDEVERLREQLRQHSIRTGQALYAWDAESGLHSLRNGELPVPGTRRFQDALRYIVQSAHFGIYFFSGYAQPLDAAMIPLLRQVAKMHGERVRRVVLLDPATSLPQTVESVELPWNSGKRARPRLRDGRWVR